MNIHILTLFPDAFPGSLGISLIGKALDQGIATVHVHDLKKFAPESKSKEMLEYKLFYPQKQMLQQNSFNNVILYKFIVQ